MTRQEIEEYIEMIKSQQSTAPFSFKTESFTITNEEPVYRIDVKTYCGKDMDDILDINEATHFKTKAIKEQKYEFAAVFRDRERFLDSPEGKKYAKNEISKRLTEERRKKFERISGSDVSSDHIATSPDSL